MTRMRAIHLLAAVAALAVGSFASPPVKVALRSSWASPPLLLELIETISQEEPDAFFPLVDVLSDPSLAVKEHLAPEALHHFVLQTAVSTGYLSRPGSLESVQMQLALHAGTPKIEAFYQHYIDTSKAQLAPNDTDACGSWVEWYGEAVCDIDRLRDLVGPEEIDASEQEVHRSESSSRPQILPFDHIYPPSSQTLDTPPRTAIFHASMTSSNFRELHYYLMRVSGRVAPRVEYVYRPIPSPDRGAGHSHLSGYGVALDLKKMDYLALDDRRAGRKGSTSGDSQVDEGHLSEPEVDQIITLLSHYELNETMAPSEPLTAEEIAPLGQQTLQLVADSPTPFATFKHLVQNFPRYASSLARRVVVNPDLEEEVRRNSFKVQPGTSIVWLNGGVISEADMNPFGLLRVVRKERNIIQSLTSLGLEPPIARRLISHPAIADAATNNEFLDGIFDASDRPEQGGLIVWWNDIEKDSRYARWPSSLYTLMRPTYPGQINVVRLNFFNTVLVVDLSRFASLDYITGMVSNMIERSFPMRFGIVPVVETEDGARMAKVFWHLIETYGRGRTMRYFRSILESPQSYEVLPTHIDWVKAQTVYDDFVASQELPEGKRRLDWETVIGDSDEETDTRLAKARSYSQRLGAGLSSAPNGHVFANGKYFELNDMIAHQLQNAMTQTLQHIQEQIYVGKLSDEDSSKLSTYFYDLPGVQKRRNKYIFPAGGAKNIRIFNVPDLFDRTGFPALSESFLYPESEKVPLTIYILTDLDSEAGLSLVQAALTFVRSSEARISFIHNPSPTNIGLGEHRRPSTLLSRLQVHGLLAKRDPDRLSQALNLEVPLDIDKARQTVLSPEAALQEISEGIAFDEDVDLHADYIKAGRLVARELGLSPGESALMVNGRVVGPIGEGGFTAEDFQVLQQHELFRRVEPVLRALEDLYPVISDYDKATFAQIVSMASSVVSDVLTPDPSEVGLLNSPPASRNPTYGLLQSEHTKIELGDNSTSHLHFAVLIDPLSEFAQRYVSLLEWLTSLPHVSAELHFHPVVNTELPLKRFYRYNLLPRLNFDESGKEIPSNAVFEDLPVEPIYTLALDIPSSWLVRPREALYDLDNIQLGVLSNEEARRGVEAVYELDYLVVGGHARDAAANGVPRGVQLQLTTSNGAPIDDTLVLANLGYFQFKAKPGVYRLEIREGRGREIFELESVGNEGWDSPPIDKTGNVITLTSFEGWTLYPRLARKPGMLFADVLEVPQEKEETGGLASVLSSISSFFKPKESAEEPTEKSVSTRRHADINIFTVASGLLYERFASIMVLSVLRNTNHSVKFWFIENFLSPSFLEFLPHFAEEYGFQYELVTYKWPAWLREQKEKQRIIWAYKILFLDTLFPMDLDKVIFVDADQIVRADLKELVDLDLHGAPYGYTPMGDDNTDMEGFRFWKQGYWQQALHGKPYHISALYVIDLNRFRQMAAGDILRTQYQALSADPHSLANLDQDLPNNLQHHVPIYSLPEDWLWCETWCSKDRLHRAKTIDLCQNPLTKEPKLARARQIPEWEEYDSEIARFTRRLAEEGRIHSSVATADVNDLANAAAASTATVETSAPEEDEEDDTDAAEDKPPRDEL